MYEIMNKEKNIIVGPKNQTIRDFYKDFSKNYPDFLSKNVIVDLREARIEKVSEILVFLNTAEEHANNASSFVIICHGMDYDELPDQLVIVPTMIEALDIIEMDEITRDLGF